MCERLHLRTWGCLPRPYFSAASLAPQTKNGPLLHFDGALCVRSVEGPVSSGVDADVMMTYSVRLQRGSINKHLVHIPDLWRRCNRRPTSIAESYIDARRANRVPMRECLLATSEIRGRYT